jgi:hypothetical protein
MSTTDVAVSRLSAAVEENIKEFQSGREISAEDIARSLRQLLDEPTHEIENLISACERLRETLQTRADCIERSIVDYAKLTGIVHEAVEKFLSMPDAPAR